MNKVNQIKLFLILLGTLAVFSSFLRAQPPAKPPELQPSIFKIGEKITYNVSFGNTDNAGYAEIYCVSRGRLEESDAVELRMRAKTTELVSAFFSVDESRTVYAGSLTGLPLLVKRSSNLGIVPKEIISNFLQVPTENFDLLTAIYHIRRQGGTGNIVIQEDDRQAAFGATITGSEKIKTDLGEFETVISNLQSQYFSDIKVSDIRINLSNDEKKIPLQIRFKTPKGEFKATAASIQMIPQENTEPPAQPTPAPTPRATPMPTPKPAPAPTPIIENRALPDEFPFLLGEKLVFKISANGQQLAKATLQIKERRESSGRDTLFLAASISDLSGLAKFISAGDILSSQVNPESLTPYRSEIKLNSTLSKFNQQLVFDQSLGAVTTSTALRIDAPIGTYDLLSFAYGVRAFNLKPSKNPANPVNDTRVSLFLGDKPYIFTIRPLNIEIIEFQGKKVSAQSITLSSGSQEIDQYAPRLWLSNDSKRLPLRFSLNFSGKTYQADLIEAQPIKR